MKFTRDIIAVLIVGGAIASLFFQVQPGAEEIVRVLAGAVIGFYFGSKEIPVMGAIKDVTKGR